VTPDFAPVDVGFRAATASDALCIGVLATQVFLDTYATDGIRPSLAREVLEQFQQEQYENRVFTKALHTDTVALREVR
jgi:hypothetical protein